MHSGQYQDSSAALGVVCTFIKDNNYSLEFLLAILNSTIFGWYFRHFIFSCEKTFRKLDNYYLTRMPIPIVSPKEQEPIVSLVKELILLKDKDPNNERIVLIEKELEILLFKIYKLTDAEIFMVQE